jgi:hypothetical protein
MVLLSGQVSLHTFDLGHWVSVHGGGAYVKMLSDLSELVNSDKLRLDLHVLDCSDSLAHKLDALRECSRVRLSYRQPERRIIDPSPSPWYC